MTSLQWITSEELSHLVAVGNSPLLIDMRSCAQFCVRHIKGAHNLSFSPILVRRMLKGCLALDSLITDHDLLQRIANARNVVLYDSYSCRSSTRPELSKFAETLLARFGADDVALRILDGKTCIPTAMLICLVAFVYGMLTIAFPRLLSCRWFGYIPRASPTALCLSKCTKCNISDSGNLGHSQHQSKQRSSNA